MALYWIAVRATTAPFTAPVGHIVGPPRFQDGPPPGPDWAQCAGTMVEVERYPDLFSVCGYRFGGDGDHFCLPDFRPAAVT